MQMATKKWLTYLCKKKFAKIKGGPNLFIYVMVTFLSRAFWQEMYY